jgi:ribosome-binding factor A
MKERIKRINNLIRNELSKIILKELEFPKDVLVTLTRVETLKDLSECRVFISVLPEEMEKEVFEKLKEQSYFLQKKLNSLLKMRKIPKIFFLSEKKLIEAARIEKILFELKKEKK